MNRKLIGIISSFCLILVLAVVPLVSACAPDEVTPPVTPPPPPSEPAIPANFTIYTNEAGLFSISYPPDWEPALSMIEGIEQTVGEIIKSIDSDAPLEQASFIFFAGVPIESGWLPNVSIVVESIPGFTGTHDEAVEMEVRGLKQLFPDYHEFSRIDETIDGRKATIIEYEATIPGSGKNHPIQMFTLVGKIVWVVTCSPELGKFSESEEDSYAIVRSLRILK